MPDCRDTLCLAFDKGFLAPPVAGEDWLFLNAALLPVAADGFSRQLLSEQGFRPEYLALQQAGYRVEPAQDLPEDGVLSGALVLLSRSRQLNEVMLSRAHRAVRPGGAIVVSGANTDGAKSMRKHVARHCGEPQSLSKHHSIAFWFMRSEAADPFPAQTKPRRGGYEIAPGMFSADGPDAGSMLLAQHFNARIEGNVADLGAGWGYLGMELLAAAPAIARLDSIEADHASLGAARTNVSPLAEDRELHFLWLDVTREPLPQDMDWVLMNPPFHDGRAARPELGNAFIEAAARALKSGGRLLMVANRQLPYEAALAAAFREMATLEERDGFKVIEAQKR